MSTKVGKRMLKRGASDVFVGGQLGRAPFSLRLEVREDARGVRHFFRTPRRPGSERGRPKLFHYISAGGMRQLRRTSADDRVEERRRSFLLFLFWLSLVWLVFYLLPSS